jgi:hypothetical protein
LIDLKSVALKNRVFDRAGSKIGFVQRSHVVDKCSYGGSKLSGLFGLVCESLGKTGVAWLWFMIGLAALVLCIRYFFRTK